MDMSHSILISFEPFFHPLRRTHFTMYCRTVEPFCKMEQKRKGTLPLYCHIRTRGGGVGPADPLAAGPMFADLRNRFLKCTKFTKQLSDKCTEVLTTAIV